MQRDKERERESRCNNIVHEGTVDGSVVNRNELEFKRLHSGNQARY